MIKLLIPLFLMLPLAGCTQKDNKNPTPGSKTEKRESIRVPAFDGQSAFGYLKQQTDFGPRVPGTTAHSECLLFLTTEMQKFAEAVNRQEFSHIGHEGKNILMTNVISSFNLKATTRILLVAHWDSRPFCDEDPDPGNRNKPVLGANDGASGIAVLLEIARHLKQHPPAIGIDMLFTDGEDYGKKGDNDNYLLGARYFAKNISPGFKPAFGILLDMIGDAQLEIPKEQYSIRYAPEIVELIWSKARELGIYQFSEKLQGFVMDDHLPLNDIGIKTIDIIDFAYPDDSRNYWHTVEDTPDKCSAESLEAVGKVLLHIIYTYPG